MATMLVMLLDNQLKSITYKSKNTNKSITVKVEIFAHFAAKWLGAKIKPHEYYVKMCVCVCKLVVREIKNMRYSSF